MTNVGPTFLSESKCFGTDPLLVKQHTGTRTAQHGYFESLNFKVSCMIITVKFISQRNNPSKSQLWLGGAAQSFSKGNPSFQLWNSFGT